MARLVAGLLLALGGGALAGAAWAAPVEVLTARGAVSLEAAPRSIAVFDIPAVDTLAHLGIRPTGLPARLYVPDLAPLADGARTVGQLHEPDLEALNALAPDLIIVGGRSSHRLEAVARLAPAIDMTIDGNDLLAEARRRLKAYGDLFARQDEAAAAAVALDAALAATRAAVAGRGNALILMANGPKVSAFGPGSRFGWLHSELGLPTAAPDMPPSIHGEAVSFEFIRAANPDWLIVIDRLAATGEGGAGAGATLDNAMVARTTAGRRGQIIHLPPADAYIAAGGVGATLRLLARVREGFQSAGSAQAADQ